MPDDIEADPTNIEALKGQVSLKTGVPSDVLRGANLEEIEAHAEALRGLLPEQSPRTPAPGYVPSEGRTIGKAAANPSSAFASFLDRQLGYTR